MEHNEFLDYAFIYLLAAVVSVSLAKRSGLGSVLGYLLAGVLIGPFGLSLIGDQTSIVHFAEFGVVMLLFIIGLELKPSLLWNMKHAIFGAGLLQMTLSTLVIGVFATLYLDNIKSAVAIGLIFALSSTAIVLQSLGERSLMKTRVGQSGFGILLFQDLAVIPIIALLPLLSSASIGNEGGETQPYISYLMPIGAIIAVVVFGRYIIRPFFRFIAKSRLREIFTASALLLVVSTALLMNAVGLSPALGAFIAGVVLAENEYRHEIESDLEPFKGLLLGLFFLGVGASIDFQLLKEEALLVAAAVIAVIASKFLILLFVGKVMALNKADSFKLAFFLAQSGEFGFVLFGFAQHGNILEDKIAATGVLAIAITMLIAPLMMIVSDKISALRLPDKKEHTADEITSDNPVIVAGFGRFGQTVSRLLMVSGFKLTILDHDADHIELVRKFGNKVFFGDVSRLDLLKAAGAEHAKLLVVAVDNIEQSLAIVTIAQKHFPTMKIAVRAINRHHAYELIRLGVTVFERETFQSAISLGKTVLKELGVPAALANKNAKQFSEHDTGTLHQLSELWGDDRAYGSAVKRNLAELQQALEADRDFTKD